MKKTSLQALINSNTDRDLSGAAASHPIGDRIAGDTHAPRDITRPIAGLAREVALSHIKADPDQPRRTMNPESLRDLAASIRENGVLQPITARWDASADTYRVIVGHRRVEAAKLAGLKAVPAIIKPDNYDDRLRLLHQLVENIQREGIPPIEEARALQVLLESTGLSQREAAQQLGKPHTYVAELLQIVRLPDELLSLASNLPKRALVEASRGKTAKEQHDLIQQALSSSSPFQKVRASRRETHKGPKQFKETYRIEGVSGAVTVAFEKPPLQVTPDDIAELLSKVIHLVLS
jgi:ParB-like partition proteins